jgi:hypothetical protein
MNATQIASKDPQYKEFAKFCNTLRCPLCKSQLDGNIHAKEAKLYCVGNNAEYKCEWHPGDDTPFFERITYWYPQYMYEISIHRQSMHVFDTRIDRLNMDVIPMYRHTTRKRMFDFNGDRILFFRQRMEENIFLKKLKMYNVFS